MPAEEAEEAEAIPHRCRLARHSIVRLIRRRITRYARACRAQHHHRNPSHPRRPTPQTRPLARRMIRLR